MLVNASRSSSGSSNSSHSNASMNSSHSSSSSSSSNSRPSTILWTQTLESITLQININHVRVLLSEQCLKLSKRSNTISLPLYGRVYIHQYNIERMMMANSTSSILLLTLEKECFDIWPHLLKQHTDNEIEAYLIEANFFIHIQHTDTLIQFNNNSLTLYDTLDFETVINGQGEKTGLE